MNTWRTRHEAFIAAIRDRPAPSGRGYAVRAAFRPIASSALTAIANAVGAPVPASLVALWSHPLDSVAEYDPEAPPVRAFGRTLSFYTPSDAKQATLTLRSLAKHHDGPALFSAIAVGWILETSDGPSERSELVIEPERGEVLLVRVVAGRSKVIQTLVASSLADALESALEVGYWASRDRHRLERYLRALGDDALSPHVPRNGWLRALEEHLR
jgi:hypothetical protein